MATDFDAIMHEDDHVEGKTVVVVDKIPNCDMCLCTPAYADGQTTSGMWANMCFGCFQVYGIGLGLGLGQALQLKSDIKER
jgi:hypothetical protein